MAIISSRINAGSEEIDRLRCGVSCPSPKNPDRQQTLQCHQPTKQAKKLTSFPKNNARISGHQSGNLIASM
jgi:hypothetical protein